MLRIVLPHTGSLSANQGTGTSFNSSQANSETHGRSSSHSRTQSSGTTRSSSHSIAQATSQGYSEGLQPIIEERSTQTYSLDEQRYEKAALIRNLPNRVAIMKLADGSPATIMRTVTVSRPVVPGLVIQTFNARALATSRFTRPLEIIEQELAERKLDIERRLAV